MPGKCHIHDLVFVVLVFGEILVADDSPGLDLIQFLLERVFEKSPVDVLFGHTDDVDGFDMLTEFGVFPRRVQGRRAASCQEEDECKYEKSTDVEHAGLRFICCTCNYITKLGIYNGGRSYTYTETKIGRLV